MPSLEMAPATQAGAPQPEGMPSHPEQIAISADHPQTTSPEEALSLAGLDKTERDKLVGIVKRYREQWQADRQIRLVRWLKNVMFDRGQQLVGYDTTQGGLPFDALAWYRQQGGDQALEAAELEKFFNPMTNALKTTFVAALSRGVPPTIIRPENAEILADVTTAKAGQDAITIIERMNRIRSLGRLEAAYFYLFGIYFKHTRYVIDGEWAGYTEDPLYGDIQVNLPDRMRCPRCAAETPMSGFAAESATTPNPPDQRNCPGCGTRMGAEHFWPAESTTEMGFTGTNKEAKGMVKWTVHSPMEIDVDPNAKELRDTPILVREVEIDVGQLRTMFPKCAEKIKQGMTSETSPDSNWDKLVRAETYSASRGLVTDTGLQKPTYSEIWMQPWTFAQDDDVNFAAKMRSMFPSGLLMTMIGPEVMDIRRTTLTKEWTCARINDEHGMFPPSPADAVVPFNERFNDSMSTIDQYMQRCTAGITLLNAGYLDTEKMKGSSLKPGELFLIYTKGEGRQKPLSEILYQFTFRLDQEILKYPDMLMSFAQIFSGIQPQLQGGGTQQGVDTLGGQQIQLDQASARLGIYWDNLKEEHAQASQNAIECLAANMNEDIWSVIEAEGSQFRNDYVHLDELQGRIRVFPDIDSGLPQSPEQIRQTFQGLLDMMAKGNPIAAEILNVLPNQEQAMAALGTPNMVLPGAAQRAATEQDLRKLLEGWGPTQVGPNGVAVPTLPCQPNPRYTNFIVAKETIMLFMQENADLQASDAEACQRVDMYYDMLVSMETAKGEQDASNKLQVTKAGMPAPPAPPQLPPPDPTIEAAKKDLLSKAQRAVDRLAEIGELPPQGKNGSVAAQVTAEGKIVDTALEVAKAASA